MSTWSAVLALAAALLTSALLPVDVFMVSFMKDPQGNFKEWAANGTSRAAAEDTLVWAYYVLYSIVLLFAFLVLPFAYFFSEDEDDEVESEARWTARACTALKYTTCFAVLAALLLSIGAVIPLRHPDVNGTEWDKIEFMIDELASNRGEDALAFLLAVLGLVGMAVIVVYMSSGMATFPLRLLLGKTEEKRDGSSLQQRTGWQKVLRLPCLLAGGGRRLLELLAGVLALVLTLLFWTSLLLANIDRAQHSLGYRMGYLLPNHTLPNPLDLLLVYAQKVFPVDYVLFVVLVLFLVLCTIYGIQRIGIWFLWLRVAHVRPGKTHARGLLLLSLSLMYVMIGIHSLIYSVAPRYITYGSQHFLERSGGTANQTTTVMQCGETVAPPDECVMTRASVLLLRFFYKAWIFGAAYYWATWLFLVVTPLAAIGFAFRPCVRSHEDDEEALEDTLEDGDDTVLRA